MRHSKLTFLMGLQCLVAAGLFLMDAANLAAKAARWGGYCLLFLTALTALLMHVRSRVRLERMVSELQRAAGGNVNTRLLAPVDPVLADMVFSINALIEQVEKVHIQSVKFQAARKRLLSSISHDIRTPLTSIIGYVDALREGVAVSEDEKRDYLKIISEKANGLKELIDEIFHMAKLDADEMPHKEEVLDLAEIARESLIEFLPELQKHAIELDVDLPEKSCDVLADRVSLLRIVRNILKNAIQYGKEGKKLGIAIEEGPDEYRLLIWDQGPGLSEEELGHVFERMYRSDASRTLSHGGSGLGLAIARALVERNGGSIWVESVPWKRTTFGFSVPRSSDTDSF
ncbi:HAMP domain-containing histidine kinase [Aneurinibacillus sp. BA2021]|nr:HAMP domain-containing histidine kinase [Aneurinibacillus sp. BA2021]